jgi:hypothetical protein
MSTTTTMSITDPCEAESLMRFTASMSYNRLSSKGDTRIGTAASLNFARKKNVMANGFYTNCMSAPKLSIKVASEQRISTTKVLFSSVVIIDEHEFTNLQFKVLLHFTISDNIFRLPTL